MSNLKLAVFLALGFNALSFFMFSQLNSTIVMYSVLVILALGIGLMMSHLPALLSLHTDKRQYGRVLGVYDSIASLSRVIGPLLAYIGFYHMLQMGYLLFSIILVIVAVLFWVLYSRIQFQLKKGIF